MAKRKAKRRPEGPAPLSSVAPRGTATPEEQSPEPPAEPPPPGDPAADAAFPVRLAAAVAAAVVVPYLAWSGNGFVYDDQVLFVARAAPQDLAGAFAVFGEAHHPSGLPYYRPLAALTLALQRLTTGGEAFPLHLVNAGLAGGLAVALARLYARVGTRSSLLAGALGALALVHPVTSSIVHAISGRETLLWALFAVLGLSGVLRGTPAGTATALACLGAALLSKEQAVTLPLVYVAAEWLRTGRGERRAGVDRIALFVGMLVVLTGWALARRAALAAAPPTDAAPLRFAVLEDPTGPLLSLGHALSSAVAPGLDLSYEPHALSWWSPVRVALGAAAVAGLGAVSTLLPPPPRRAALFWVAFAALTLLPSANLVSQETEFDDRYVAVPLFGMLGAAGALLGSLAAERGRLRALTLTVTGLAAVAGAVSTHRGRFFRDDPTFLGQWSRSDPSSYQAEASLAELARGAGDLEAAIGHEREAIRRMHGLRREPWCIKRHFALAELLERTGRPAEAVSEYEEILRLRPDFSGAARKLEAARRRAGAPAGAAPPIAAGDLASLVDALRAGAAPGQVAYLADTAVDPRSGELAGKLERAFAEAGYRVAPRQTVRFAVKPGLHLFAADETAPESVDRIASALKAAGLEARSFATGYRAYAEERRAADPAWAGFHLGPDQPFLLVVGRGEP